MDGVADAGIQVSAGAVIRNNLIYNNGYGGINIQNNANNLMSGKTPRNIRIEHNTIVNNNGGTREMLYLHYSLKKVL